MTLLVEEGHRSAREAVRGVLRSDGSEVPPETFQAVRDAVVEAARASKHGRRRNEDVCDWLERIGCGVAANGAPEWARRKGGRREV